MKVSSEGLYHLIYYYFAFSAIVGFFQMVGIEQTSHLLKFVVFPVYILTFCSLKKGIGLIGVAIFFIIIIIAFTSLFQNYPRELYKIGLTGELFAMLFFFVGKFDNNNEFFKKGILPIVLTGVIGIILFSLQPSWYLSYKLEGLEKVNDSVFLEMTRLSVFWKYPYWISYGSAILYCYLFCGYFKQDNISKLSKLISIILLVVMVLAQQRGPLFVCIVYTFLILFFSHSRQFKEVRNFSFQIIIIILLLGIIAISLFREELINYITEKITILFDNTSKNSSFLKERADIFYGFYNKKITIFGDGIGRYGHAAMEFGKEAITDQQYLKMVYETGYFGLISRLTIILFILIKGFRHFKYKYFEVSIIILYLITMFGANSIAMGDTHNCVFWLCCGRICNKKNLWLRNDDMNCKYFCYGQG